MSEPGDVYRGMRRKGIFILLSKVFKTSKDPAFLQFPHLIILSLSESFFFSISSLKSINPMLVKC